MRIMTYRKLRRAISFAFVLVILLVLATGCDGSKAPSSSPAVGPSTPTATIEVASEPAAPERKTLEQLVEQYHSLGLTDVHNHDASGSAYAIKQSMWDQNAVSRVVLFGDVSEPSAVLTDAAAWEAYVGNPDHVVPYFSGIDLHDKSAIDDARRLLEQGYFGIGEIVGASTYSPVVSKVAWKAFDPMDGILPQLYELCAEYKAPVLLHIDPMAGEPIVKLEEALDAYPDTIIIVGHINAYNSPANVEALMAAHPNLYADFFAGFTDLNPDSGNTLEDFVPVMKKFSDRFLLSTDSGYGLDGEEAAAIESMYRMVDLLNQEDPEVAKRIAHDNYDAILQAEPATKTQLEALGKLDFPDGQKPDLTHLSKLEAGRLLIDAQVDMTQ
ncbi:amidohydrolase family protein [Cohnella yongneupensis]|uniref:Amidohydrolase family protein n=1 Tax=Cohnella yongneupensis TaxID=425006 RepID=A0ABW0QVQ7_9BACL